MGDLGFFVFIVFLHLLLFFFYSQILRFEYESLAVLKKNTNTMLPRNDKCQFVGFFMSEVSLLLANPNIDFRDYIFLHFTFSFYHSF